MGSLESHYCSDWYLNISQSNHNYCNKKPVYDILNWQLLQSYVIFLIAIGIFLGNFSVGKIIFDKIKYPRIYQTEILRNLEIQDQLM